MAETATGVEQDRSRTPAIRAIFLHHSVGADLLRGSGAREALKWAPVPVHLWDYAYNPPRRILFVGRRRTMPDHYYGLRDADGRQRLGRIEVPNDNTDPAGLAALFRQPVTSSPANAFSYLLQFDVVLFKSCFTAAAITSDEQLERYRQDYLEIRSVIDRHPERLFLPLTMPPLSASMTTPEQAARARAFAAWLASDAYREGRRNLHVFDLFDALAVPDGKPDSGTLRPEYCPVEVYDSHPNGRAQRAVGAAWVAWVAEAVERADWLRAPDLYDAVPQASHGGDR